MGSGFGGWRRIIAIELGWCGGPRGDVQVYADVEREVDEEAGTIKRAEADDPKLLRKQLVATRREIARRPTKKES